MGEPTTPAEERRQGLNRARWVATGAAVGAAALLGGVIAAANGAPASSSDSNQLVRDNDGIGDDEYVPAQPFQPQTQQQQTQPQTPQFSPQSGSGGTRSGGS